MFYKNVKSSFSARLTHLTLRFLYIFDYSGPRCGVALPTTPKLHCTFIHFCKILSGFILLLFVLFGGVAGKATTSAPRFTTQWCILEISCQFRYVFDLRFRTLAILYALWVLCRIVNNSLKRRRWLGLVGLFVC